LYFLEDTHEAGQIRKIAVTKFQGIANTKPTQAVIVDAGMGGSANDSSDRVTLLKEKLGQIRPILAGYSGY
jgi:hypothetical protein